MVGAPARRKAALRAIEHGRPQRRACALFQTARSALFYQSRLPARDAELAAKLRVIAEKHVGYGSPRATAQLRREGIIVNQKRVERVWRNEGLTRPRRRKYRKIKGNGKRAHGPAQCPNHIWAYDFVEDRCANGAKLRCLTIIDEYTRDSLAITVATSMPAPAVLETLEQLIAEHGAPVYLRSDNGPEFIANAVKEWLKENDIETAYIDPGKPWQNGSNESFNGTFRAECLSRSDFANVAEARVIIGQWRNYYRCERLHSSIGYVPPAEYARAAALRQAKVSEAPPPELESAGKIMVEKEISDDRSFVSNDDEPAGGLTL